MMMAAAPRLVQVWHIAVEAWRNASRKRRPDDSAHAPLALEPQVSPRMLLAIGLITGLLGATVVTARSIEHAPVSSVIALLARLEQDDARWTNDILSVQLGVLSNYDPLAAPFYGLQEGRDDLRAVTKERLMLPEADLENVKEVTQELSAALARKIDLAGKIAAQFAIENNSTHALSAAMDVALRILQTTALPTQKAHDVSGLIARAALLGRGPQPRGSSDAIESLRNLVPSLPEELQPSIRAVAAHGAIIMAQRERGIRLAAELQALPVSRLMIQLQDIYAAHRDRLIAQGDFYRWIIVVLIALLAGSLVMMAWQLRRDARRIGEAYQGVRREQVALEAQLVQSTKLASLGQMIAGIAHEINTPLAYLRATLEMLQKFLEEAIDKASAGSGMGNVLVDRRADSETSLYDDIRSLLKDGIYGAERIAEFIRSLKNFSRRDDASTGVFSLTELADSALTLSMHTTKYVAQTERAYEPVPKVRCAPSQIVQVLLNVINNSVHAMEGRDGKGQLTVTIAPAENDMVRIDVADNGCGIPPDILPRIMEPFFSTKKVGEGVGLGLAVCSKIIEAHKGEIFVSSTVGVGTTTSILLPVAPAKSEVGANLGKLAR